MDPSALGKVLAFYVITAALGGYLTAIVIEHFF